MIIRKFNVGDAETRLNWGVRADGGRGYVAFTIDSPSKDLRPHTPFVLILALSLLAQELQETHGVDVVNTLHTWGYRGPLSS